MLEFFLKVFLSLIRVYFNVKAKFSQECADCSHIHADNRQNQSQFFCLSCGHAESADKNAAQVIKKSNQPNFRLWDRVI